MIQVASEGSQVRVPAPAMADGAVVEPAAPGHGEPADSAAANASGVASFAQENETHRRKALDWLGTEPLPQLLMARNVLVPLQLLQRRQIWISTPKWERQQAAIELQWGGLPCRPGLRTYLILLAAECGLEEESMQGLRMMLRMPELWALMPEDSLVARDVALAHRLVSRAWGIVP